jgi:4'-phosphopantetheinyl transferase
LSGRMQPARMIDHSSADGIMMGTEVRENENTHRDVVNHGGRFSVWPVDPVWLSPSANCSLPDTDIHIWRGWLDQPAWHVQQLAQTLSADECVRANRFRFEMDRTRFIVARGLLRSILGYYLGIEPGQVRLCYGRHGKPYLHEDFRALIRFNVAHSHQLAVYAFARAREIGIDLEYARPMPRSQQTAAEFMSAHEMALLSELPIDQQQEAFYLCWTRKEAYVKATGIGLEQPLGRLSVSLVPGEPARLLNVEGNPGETYHWSLRSFRPAPGYVAALAVEGHDCHTTFWDLATLHPPYAASGR